MKSPALISALLVALLPLSARANVIDDWASIKAPPPPAVQAVTVDPSTTALLVLDFVTQTCSGPVCQATVPSVGKFLQIARAKHMLVVYSHTSRSTMADTLPAVAPLPDEPNVVSSANKFNNTNLMQILTAKGIKTVIVTGVSAEGAVMFTGSQAAFAGFNVIVPVDGMSSENPYALQYVAWSFTHAPTLGAVSKLTTLGQIGFSAASM